MTTTIHTDRNAELFPSASKWERSHYIYRSSLYPRLTQHTPFRDILWCWRSVVINTQKWSQRVEWETQQLVSTLWTILQKCMWLCIIKGFKWQRVFHIMTKKQQQKTDRLIGQHQQQPWKVVVYVSMEAILCQNVPNYKDIFLMSFLSFLFSYFIIVVVLLFHFYFCHIDGKDTLVSGTNNMMLYMLYCL